MSLSEHYIGSELDLFAEALTWKGYWSTTLRPYFGRRILDVGAGIGGTAKMFPDLSCERYLALEPDRALCLRMQHDAARGLFPRNFEVATGTLTSIGRDRAFDTILYIDVLEHIDRDQEELELASHLLAPGGRLIVLSPAHQWLYSEFDSAVGHFRRYNARSLLATKPFTLDLERVLYLDSVGMLASLANRLLLRASSPSPGQIALWDRRMVPLSRKLDPILSHRVGKTIICIFNRSAP